MKNFSISTYDNIMTIALFNNLKDLEEASTLLRNYKSAVKLIYPDQYTLNLDFKRLPIIAKSKLETFCLLFMLCREARFKKINAFSSNAFLSLQIQRLFEKLSMENYSIIDCAPIPCDSANRI